MKQEIETSAEFTEADGAELVRLASKLHAAVMALNQTGIPYASVEVRVSEHVGAYRAVGFMAFVGETGNMFDARSAADLLKAIANMDPAKLKANKIANLRAELAALEAA